MVSTPRRERRFLGFAQRYFRAAPGGAGQATVLQSLLYPKHGVSEDVEAMLRSRQVGAIRRMSVHLMLVNIVNVATLQIELWISSQTSVAALAWSGLALAMALNILNEARRNPIKAPRFASRRAVRKVVLSSAMFGILWSFPGLVMLPQLTGMPLAFATALLTGMIAGGAIVLYPIPMAALAFLVPVSIASITGLALAYGWLAIGPSIIALAFLAIFFGVIRRHAELFTSEFIARLGVEQRNRLIEDLLEDARLEALGARRLIEVRLAQSQKAEAIGRLSAGIAHSFNNILTAVQGNAELATLEGGADKTLIVPILEGCQSGAEQVRRLLSVGQKQKLSPTALDLPLFCEQIAAPLETALGDRIRLEVVLAPGLWKPVVDPVELETALIGLALNARDALPKGGSVVLRCRNAPHALELQAANRAASRDGVCISIEDDGDGMDQSTLAHATEPFFSTKRFSAGHGLGLASVDGFARQSGGAFDMESILGEGTKATITLPRYQARTAHLGSLPDAEQKSVLVVDDDPASLAETERMLRSLGHRVVGVSGAEEAIQLLSTRSDTDLVLTDILLGQGITGIQLGREVGVLTNTIPVAYMCGITLSRRTNAEMGPQRILSKPFTRGQLAAYLHDAMDAAWS